MKTGKDKVLLVITIAIFAVIVMLIYSQTLAKKTATSAVTAVEVIDPISTDYNAKAIATLSDPKQTINFQPNIELNNLGNSVPFGPLR
jgi:hypothetical protein